MQQPVIEEGVTADEPTTSGASTIGNVKSYDDLFPALPESQTAAHPAASPQWGSNMNKMRVGSSVITQVFHVPYEELNIYVDTKFGEGESVHTCKSIMKETGAHIEISHGKDQSLTFLVIGKQNEVLTARNKILTHFQTQAHKSIRIPKEHYKWIIGKKGERLRELQRQTGTEIVLPTMHDDDDSIVITGPKEGIEKAEHEIRLTSEQQSKKAQERLNVPKIYHPFILGPYGANLDALMETTGAKINIPPPSVMKDEIFITGEKEGVLAAKEQIEAIYRLMEKKCTSVSVEVPPTQHKYVIGPKRATISEIFDETGVSVEMPPSDSNSGTITLRGPSDRLGLALGVVYDKANSVMLTDVSCPAWLHKYIIGKKGQRIKEITQNLPKVHVEFTDKDKIKIEGPPEEAEKAQETIEAVAQDLIQNMTFVEMHVDNRLFKHIIGKSGANVNKLKDEFNVVINIDESGLIRIEGKKDDVANTKAKLEQQIFKLENEKERDVVIEHYRNIIGPRGESIRDIGEKFRNVQILFPGKGDSSDIVKVRGPKEEVDECVRTLEKRVKETYFIQVPVYKQFHKYLIGKHGAVITKIREETKTKIELPAECDTSDCITITGKRENVEDALERIKSIQNHLENIVSEKITIDPKFYNSLIGAKGKLIHLLMRDCGGVQIEFPKPDSNSDKVTIRGPKEDVEQARQQLLDLVNEKQVASFNAEVRTKPQHHKFLIGKGGANIKKIRDATGARIIFPSNDDEDQEVITIIGRQEAVEEAKQQLEAMIKKIEFLTVDEMRVEQKHHKHFVARRGEVLNKISDECGGVMISFPRSGVDSDRVVLEGTVDCIEAAKQRINEIISDLESMVTIECVIPQPHHGNVMGQRGWRVQGITSEYEVQIKFPDKENTEAYNTELTNGDVESEPVRCCDVIKITGKESNCLLAKQALLDLVPVTIEVDVPFEMHRAIIGTKGQAVKALMNQFNVHIVLSSAEEQEDIIKVTGLPENVKNAKEALHDRVKELEADKKLRELKSYTLNFEVDPEYHPKIIGRKGMVITKIRKNNDVIIKLPKKGEENEHIITIIGLEENANRAKDEILKIVHELDDLYKEEIEIKSRVHSRLIGARGRKIRTIMEEFKVDIKFPKSTDPNPNLIVISGPEENVIDCRDHLLNLAEEYLQDDEEQQAREQLHTLNFRINNAEQPAPADPQSQNNPSGDGPRGDGRRHMNRDGFVVQGGPWEQSAPNMASVTDFPAFGRAAEPPQAAPVPGAWGNRR
ncbi:vigilin [Anthonomus grandis grandis]|uniref:vigilin n=1 Tax=Anthonomus grandis grandis TaxID=2921223 RepID=UPI0021653808|nr:vigilin [Anthonomus grandis grandis]